MLLPVPSFQSRHTNFGDGLLCGWGCRGSGGGGGPQKRGLGCAPLGDQDEVGLVAARSVIIQNGKMLPPAPSLRPRLPASPHGRSRWKLSNLPRGPNMAIIKHISPLLQKFEGKLLWMRFRHSSSFPTKVGKPGAKRDWSRGSHPRPRLESAVAECHAQGFFPTGAASVPVE